MPSMNQSFCILSRAPRVCTKPQVSMLGIWIMNFLLAGGVLIEGRVTGKLFAANVYIIQLCI